MSRIRSVFPGLFTDEVFVALSDTAKVFFIGLWTEADDFGVFEWKPLTLKMKLLAGSTTAADPLLDELLASDRIRLFKVEGRLYGVIHNFVRFQRPRRPSSFHPMPLELYPFAGRPVPKKQTVSGTSPVDSGQTRESPKQMEDGGWRMEDGGGKVKNPPPHPETRSRARPKRAPPGALVDEGEDFDFSQEFDVLWALFPRKIDRGRALAAYQHARRSGVPLALIRAGIERFAADSAGKARKHVARPENWLRGERWFDEPDDGRIPGSPLDDGRGDDGFAYAAESTEHWRDRCALWFDRTRGGPLRDRWLGIWGPAPGEPGCRAPTAVLAEFGWSGEAQ